MPNFIALGTQRPVFAASIVLKALSVIAVVRLLFGAGLTGHYLGLLHLIADVALLLMLAVAIVRDRCSLPARSRVLALEVVLVFLAWLAVIAWPQSEQLGALLVWRYTVLPIDGLVLSLASVASLENADALGRLPAFELLGRHAARRLLMLGYVIGAATSLEAPLRFVAGF